MSPHPARNPASHDSLPNRETFFARLRAALDAVAPCEARQARRVPDLASLTAARDRAARLCRHTEDLPAVFSRSAQQVGMRVVRVVERDISLVLESELRRTSPDDAPIAVFVRDSSHDQMSRAAVECTGRRLLVPPAATFDALYDAAASITDVQAAVAETGSIVIASDPAHSRGCFLVPPVHIALIRASQIVPDLVDLFPPPAPPPPTAIVRVTGPS
ncbi:MAG: LUD domain-containing protein [Phycisphaerales bacterium]